MNNKNNKAGQRLITLEEYIINAQNKFPGATGELSQLLRDIGIAAKIISREVNKAGITNLLGTVGATNVHGESTQRLDLFANDQLLSALSRSNITCMVISEENEGIVRLSTNSGKYIVFIDPLDGSSNINVNVSIGSIFSIYKRDTFNRELTEEDALQPGTKQVAGGYIMYGSSTVMTYTTGMGVHMFTLDPSLGEFILSKEKVNIPDEGNVYSTDEGSYNFWEPAMKKYVKYCQEIDPATNRPHKARYVGAMAADVHRTLLQGGIFMYPDSSKYPNGKLRLMYECNPLSYIIEQAGGVASNGSGRIMEIVPASIHECTPIYIGSKSNVERLLSFFDE